MDPPVDGRITNAITNKLVSRGLGAPCRVMVQTSHGQVTLSGTVEHSHQVTAALGAARGMTGVVRVINLITVRLQVLH